MENLSLEQIHEVREMNQDQKAIYNELMEFIADENMDNIMQDDDPLKLVNWYDLKNNSTFLERCDSVIRFFDLLEEQVVNDQVDIRDVFRLLLNIILKLKEFRESYGYNSYEFRYLNSFYDRACECHLELSKTLNDNLQ